MCPKQPESSVSVEGDPGAPEGGDRLERVLAFSTVPVDHPLRKTVVAFKFGGSSLLERNECSIRRDSCGRRRFVLACAS